MSYKQLKIWKLSRKLSIEIYEMSLKLPQFELYETGLLIDEELFEDLMNCYIHLGKMINNFRNTILKHHKSSK